MTKQELLTALDTLTPAQRRTVLAMAKTLRAARDAVAAALAAAASAVMVQLAEDDPQAVSLRRTDGGVVIGTTEQVGDVWLEPGAVATLRGLLLLFDESLELEP